MKAWVIAAVSILVGIGAGFGGVFIEFAGVPDQFEPHNQRAGSHDTGLAEDQQPVARAVVVDGRKYDFGKGQRFTKMKHTFVIKNEGTAPLTLKKGSTSCRCTLSILESESIQPGESAEVTLEWKMNVAGRLFRQTADINTNDPDDPKITLEIEGKITDMLRLDPDDIVFSSISDSEGGRAQFRFYAYDMDDFRIVEHEFGNEESASFFDLTCEELTPDDLKKEPGATAGYLVTLIAKPGLPLGAINQTILLTTNVEEAPKLELPVTGIVVGDISIVGPGVFDYENNMVRFGRVKSAEGAKTSLRLLVKGPYRRDVQLKIKEVSPDDVLAASLGEPQQVNNGAVYMHLLTVEVLKGSRTVNCLGSDLGEYGRVVIETTHPVTKEVTVYVRFTVQ